MIPHDPSRPQIDPRQLVRKEGGRALWELLVSVGYIPLEYVFEEFLQALLSHLPWAITGIRGGGKTALPLALAECCNLNHWGLTGRRGIKDHQLLYSWDRYEQREWMTEARAAGVDVEEARKKKWTREFLNLGEVLGAYDEASRSEVPPLLFLDELEKLSQDQQNSLLQPLCNGVMFIPGLLPDGFVGCKDPERWPIVISAANGRINSAPLRSRHLATPIDTPDIKKEVEILFAQVPETDPFLLKVVVKILDAIRAVPGLDDPPALRESIYLLKAFNRDRLSSLPDKFLMKYLCYLVKHPEDRAYLIQQLDYVEACARAEHEELDMWVDFVIEDKSSQLVGA
jgi:MoxR-like ATPase